MFLVVRVGKKRGHARQEARHEFNSTHTYLFFFGKNGAKMGEKWRKNGAKDKNREKTLPPPFPPKLAPARGDDWHGENVGDELHLSFR